MILDYGFIALDGKKVFEKITFKNEGRVEKALDNEACFMFILQGGFKVRTPLKKLDVSQNEGFLTKCGEFFFEDFHINEADAPIVEAVAVYFHPTMLLNLFATQPIQCNNNITSKLDITEALEKYKESLVYYINNQNLFTVDLQLLKVKELVLLLYQSTNSPSFNHYVSALFSPTEYDFVQVIENNCISSLKVSDMAKLCNMSLATFKRKFNEVYNCNPSQYFKTKKLERAAKLLKSSKARINEVAFDCGFESIRSFNRMFKAYSGVPPTNFRLSQNG